MITRIGLAVTHDRARVVVVRRGRAVWAGETCFTADDNPRDAISQLLRQAPVVRLTRPSVSAVLGPHASQFKRIVGLPHLTDAESLARILRENTGAFFLRNGVPLVTTRARVLEAGSVLAAALDRPWLTVVSDACKAAGLRLKNVAPTAVALGGAFAADRIQWTDGLLTLDLELRDGVPAVIRCFRGASVTQGPPVDGLAVLGEQAVHYADAFGAVTLGRTNPLVLSTPDLESGNGATWERLMLPSALALASLGALLLSPLAATLIAARANHQVAAVPLQRRDAARLAASEIERVSRTLREIAAFADARPATGRLLADVAQALPPSTVLRSFSADTTTGQLELLTQNPGSVLAAVKRLPGMTAVAFLGTMSRQTWAGRDVQHVIISFRVDPRGSR